MESIESNGDTLNLESWKEPLDDVVRICNLEKPIGRRYGGPCGTLNDLISELHRVFQSDRIDVDEVKYLMSSYKSNPAEWIKFAKFDQYRYTRNLVDTGNEKFNLMVLCWGEGHGSSIHDHADAHCFMKILAGCLSEARFEWPEKELTEEELQLGNEAAMKEVSRKPLKLDQVCYINDSMGLHRVENLSYTDRAVSLHLYSPPFNSCSVFDQHTGHKTTANVTFWSVNGKRNKGTYISPEAN